MRTDTAIIHNNTKPLVRLQVRARACACQHYVLSCCATLTTNPLLFYLMASNSRWSLFTSFSIPPFFLHSFCSIFSIHNSISFFVSAHQFQVLSSAGLNIYQVYSFRWVSRYHVSHVFSGNSANALSFSWKLWFAPNFFLRASRFWKSSYAIPTSCRSFTTSMKQVHLIFSLKN